MKITEKVVYLIFATLYLALSAIFIVIAILYTRNSLGSLALCFVGFGLCICGFSIHLHKLASIK